MEQLRREEERRHAEREQVRKHLTDRCHAGGCGFSAHLLSVTLMSD